MKFGLTVPSEKRYILGARKHNGYLTIPVTKKVTLDNVGEIVLQSIKKQRKNGLSFAAFNYINCIVGSGIIGIPYALRQSGFGVGLFLLAMIAFISDYSLILMLRSSHLCDSYSYQGVMEASFGFKGFILLSVLQLIYPITAMVSYNIIVGDTMTKVLVRIFSFTTNSIFLRRDVVVGIATLLITVPLCMLRDLVPLARASMFSFFLVIGMIVSISVRLFTLSDAVQKTEDAFEFVNWNIIPSFSIMAFAFMCHHNVFLLYDSLENANQEKWNKLTHWSVFLSWLILVLFGITGYATFTGFTEGDLLENYCWDDDLINVTRFAFAVTVLFAFPIECMTARSVIKQLINVSRENWSYTEHIVITLLIVVVTYLISVTTSCLSFVLEMNGVFSAIPLAFVLPALCFMKLEEGSIFSKKKLPSLGLSIFGLICSLFGCALIYFRLGEGNGCSRKMQPVYCFRNSNDTI